MSHLHLRAGASVASRHAFYGSEATSKHVIASRHALYGGEAISKRRMETASS